MYDHYANIDSEPLANASARGKAVHEVSRLDDLDLQNESTVDKVCELCRSAYRRFSPATSERKAAFHTLAKSNRTLVCSH
jgi:hypothetical protein